MDHEKILDAAFADTKNTAITLPPADVNKVIQSSYRVDRPFTYTRTQLWDMEDRKAHGPDKYLRYLLRPGSLEIFNLKKEGSLETFVRVTDQRLWKDPSQFTTVIEQVFLDHDARRAFFIGVTEVEAPDGRKIVRGQEQPCFHVEHSVAGTEKEPLNIWRIVHLDNDKDGEMRGVFRKMAESSYLRDFHEVYIREDLGRELIRLDAQHT
jgi:hypothetical protein